MIHKALFKSAFLIQRFQRVERVERVRNALKLR